MAGHTTIDLGHRRRFDAGERVFTENELGDTAYFIESGGLEVSRGEGDNLVVLAQLGPGEIIGEMALIDSAPRSATVQAIGPTELSIIDRQTLHQRLEMADPMVQLLVHSLLGRLRKASSQVGVGATESITREALHDAGVTGIHASARQSADIEARLRRGIAADELQLHYQPIVSFDGGETIGFEGLLRWPKPEGGFYSPLEFIDLAEQTLLILDIDEWVVRRACRDVAALQHGDLKPYVSVNISGRQFASQSFLPMLQRVLDDTGADPRRIQIEVTEGAMIESPQHAAEVLKALRDMGMKVALDDFGTGYSSLSYLQKLHANVLKIDRSFVLQMRQGRAGATIIRAIAALANALEMTVIVEGVETNAEALRLRGIGCDYAQGYGYSRPMPLEDAVAWLAKGPAQITA